MEPLGTILEGEWGSFTGTYAAEEADFMALLLNNGSALAGDSSLEVPSSFWPGHGSYHSSGMANPNFYGFSQGSSYTGGSSNQHRDYLSDSHQILAPSSSSMSMDYCMVDMKNSSSFFIEGDDFLNHERSDGNAEESAGNVPTAALPEKDAQLKRKSEMPEPDSIPEEKCDNPSENPKKRSRSSADVQRKNKRTAQPRKNQKTSINEEDSTTGLSDQAPSNCSSDDDCNASQELTGAVTSRSSAKGSASQNNGKTRASRGSATDPQSLYARKRRERINERLKILQNLVPNGTKVDISTMLEEAVQYVKFLQLQIKLLSSDDLWMYAPLAYNGMDIGLDLKINLPRQSS